MCEKYARTQPDKRTEKKDIQKTSVENVEIAVFSEGGIWQSNVPECARMNEFSLGKFICSG